MKTREMVAYQPEVIFLGSSRTRMGLDPAYYRRLTGESAYNMGLSSSNIYVQMRYLEYAVSNNLPLKKVVLGIDFAGFNEYGLHVESFKEERLKSRNYIKQDIITTLLTEQAAKDTMKVMKDNFFGSHDYTIDNFLPDGSQNESNLIDRHERYLSEGKNMFFESLSEFINNEHYYRKYRLSQESLQYFNRIITICKENKIELITFIHPVHAMQLEGIYQTGNWHQYEQWKREIMHLTPIWDFSGYNAISTTPPSNFEYYIDQSHYRKHVGNIVLRTLLHGKREEDPEDFGFYLTDNSIDSHLSSIKTGRAEWIKENPKIIQKIKDL